MDEGASEDSADTEDTDDSQRRCHNCGESLTRYSKFCSSCGAERELDADRPTGGESDDGGTEQDQSRSGGSRSTPGGSRRQSQSGRADPGGRLGGQQQQGPGGGGNQRTPGPQNQQQGGRRAQQGGGPRNQQRGDRGPRQGGGRGNQQQRGRGGPQRQRRQTVRQPDRAVTAGPASDRDMAAVTHILGLFTGLLGTLLIYAVTDDPFVKQNAANATNWQIMVIIYSIVSLVLIFLLVGFILLPALVLADFAFALIATIKATNGEAWEYPITPGLL